MSDYVKAEVQTLPGKQAAFQFLPKPSFWATALEYRYDSQYQSHWLPVVGGVKGR